MRIGLFTDTYYPEINGVANSVYTLFENLRVLGHDVHVFAPRCKGSEEKADGHVHYLPSVPLPVLKDRNMGMYGPLSILDTAKYAFDVVHTNSEFSLGMLGRMVGREIGCACVHTYHTVWEDYVYYVTHGVADDAARALARKYSSFWCNHFEAVIAPTIKTQRLLESYGVTAPVHVIPSGLEIARFAPEKHDEALRRRVRTECGVREGERVLLYLGRIAKEKNLDQVLRVFPQLHALCPDVRLVIVGEGPLIPDLKAQAQALDCADSVSFPGPKPWKEIDNYYAMGDVFVSASHSETQGLTYIEAMAAGLCVAAYDDPCLEGVIASGENGLLFEDSDEAMLQTLVRAFSPEGREIAARAPESVARYAPLRFARAVEKVYRDVTCARAE
jgi:1,2-diacylglycerol 3-alpha-glucosyltransferase